jgi:hypothetical protein
MKPYLVVPYAFVVFFAAADRLAWCFTSPAVERCDKQVERSKLHLLCQPNKRADAKVDQQKIPFDFSMLPSSIKFVPPWKPSTPFVCEDT